MATSRRPELIYDFRSEDGPGTGTLSGAERDQINHIRATARTFQVVVEAAFGSIRACNVSVPVKCVG